MINYIRKIIKYLLIYFYCYNKSFIFRIKIKRIYSHLRIKKKIFDKGKLREHKKKWSSLKNNVNPLWYKVFNFLCNSKDINFVPEDIYYTIIEPCLNNKQLAKAYSDKNFYNKMYGYELFPDIILRNIDGFYYDKYYNRILKDQVNNSLLKGKNDKLIIKPAIDTGGGKSVELFNKLNGKYINGFGEELTNNWLEKNYERNFLIQEYINQHGFFKQFNKDSVNTVRIFTYRSIKDDQVIILQAVLRVGKKGSHVDNQASGGVSCGINNEGILNTFFIDKFGNKLSSINGVSVGDSTKVPMFAEMIDQAKDVAKANLYSRLLGFDFYIDINAKVKLIEINNINNEINFYQMNNGPLFKNYTNEIIDYCKESYKTFVLDFNYK